MILTWFGHIIAPRKHDHDEVVVVDFEKFDAIVDACERAEIDPRIEAVRLSDDMLAVGILMVVHRERVSCETQSWAKLKGPTLDHLAAVDAFYDAMDLVYGITLPNEMRWMAAYRV